MLIDRLIVAIATAVTGAAAAQPAAVQTRSGPVRGTDAAIATFKGIPYAGPPTGERRWRPPAPPEPWTAVRDATRFGPQCPQPRDFAPRASSAPAAAAAPVESSEDCLTLNVWTPAKSPRERLPVLVWLHGGRFTIGSGAQTRFSGEALAERGAVVVTLNYRLGALGFFAHPELSRESDRHVSGNYGLLDQIAALAWVRDNIAAFGGDPANVTLFGQSAGANSVAVLMVSPLARGLFHRAIAQSAGTSGTFGPKPRLRESSYGLPPAESKGASLADIRTLRALSPDELLARLPNARTFGTDWHFGPVIDGYVLPDDPAVLLGTSAQAKVPLLIGFNADEALFYRNESSRTLPKYLDFLRKLLPAELADKVLAAYPATDDTQAAAAVLRMFSDFRFIAPTVLTSRAVSQAGDVYAYRFARVSPQSRSAFGGAGHGTEVPYVFGHVPTGESQYEEVDRTVSRAMAGAWVQFAKTGQPNGDGLPSWPAYTAPDYRVLEYGDAIQVRSNAGDPHVELFRQVFEAMRRKSPTPQEDR